MYNKHKVGLTFGAFFGIAHLAWSLAVAMGVAKTWMDWILGLHFISVQYTIKPFDLGTAITLVIVTAIVGYVIGYVLVAIWNNLKSR